MRQDLCLELLGANSLIEVHENNTLIQDLLKAILFTTDTPLERIINAVKEEVSDLILRARTEILSSAQEIPPIWLESVLQTLESQSYRFPRDEFIEFKGRLEQELGSTPLLNILNCYIAKHRALEARLTWLMKPITAEEVLLLDPKEDCEQIYHFLSYEFRTEMKIIAILYEVRAIVAASTNSFFLNTREFTERSVKRITDTVILFANALEWGFDTYRGRLCINKINEIHGRYYIPNESFKFILAGIIFTPEDWNNRFGWRSFTEIEKLGWFHAIAKVGKAMMVQDIPDSYEDMKEWYHQYCRRYAQPSDLKRKLFDQIIGQVLAVYPEKARPLLLSAILAGMDDIFRIATGYPEPPKEVCDAVKSTFFTLGHLGASLPRIPWIRTLQSNSFYPFGYRIEELGVNQRSSNLPQLIKFKDRLQEIPCNSNGGYPTSLLPIQEGCETSLTQLPLFTTQEVEKHNTETDLWVIIDSQVFDLSRFIQDHPGGKRVLLQSGGKDASIMFHKANHSPAAQTLMLNYRIGKIAVPIESQSQGPSTAVFSKTTPI